MVNDLLTILTAGLVAGLLCKRCGTSLFVDGTRVQIPGRVGPGDHPPQTVGHWCPLVSGCRSH